MFIIFLLCLWTQAKCDAQQDKKSDWMKTIMHLLSFLHPHWLIAAQLGCASLLWLCKNRVPFFINVLSTSFMKACAGFSFTVCFLSVFAVNFWCLIFISNVLVIKCQFRIEYPLTWVLHLISWCVTVCVSGWASSMKHKQGEFLCSNHWILRFTKAWFYSLHKCIQLIIHKWGPLFIQKDQENLFVFRMIQTFKLHFNHCWFLPCGGNLRSVLMNLEIWLQNRCMSWLILDLWFTGYTTLYTQYALKKENPSSLRSTSLVCHFWLLCVML